MRDDHRSATGERSVGGALQCHRARATGLGGGLVQHRDGRIGQHRPGQGELLGAGGAQLVAAVSHHVVEGQGGADGVQGRSELGVGGVGHRRPSVRAR